MDLGYFEIEKKKYDITHVTKHCKAAKMWGEEGEGVYRYTYTMPLLQDVSISYIQDVSMNCHFFR